MTINGRNCDTTNQCPLCAGNDRPRADRAASTPPSPLLPCAISHVCYHSNDGKHPSACDLGASGGARGGRQEVRGGASSQITGLDALSSAFQTTRFQMARDSSGVGYLRTPMTLELQGQCVVVTGGGHGIGRALAERFAAEGAKVVVADLNAPRAEKVAQRIGGLAVPGDVASPEAMRALVAQAVEAFGTV